MMKITKAGVLLGLLAFLICIVMYDVSAEPVAENSFLRVEVKTEHGEHVQVTAPLTLLDTLYNVMPKEIKELCKELKLKPEQILAELKKMEGKDLVRVSGRDNVRIWIEEAKPENVEDLDFFKVHVKEGQEQGHEVDVCLPRGLIQLAGHVIQSLGLVDQFVELPDEIKNLKVASESE
ncbi:MAG: hypothetical protein C4527_27830 [Candidatus Omnitrophota bacterium]|nr:MAG: hypothetical protein C4527_27830 [Candidatus Omnitrophota bacterium]